MIIPSLCNIFWFHFQNPEDPVTVIANDAINLVIGQDRCGVRVGNRPLINVDLDSYVVTPNGESSDRVKGISVVNCLIYLLSLFYFLDTEYLTTADTPLVLLQAIIFGEHSVPLACRIEFDKAMSGLQVYDGQNLNPP